MVANELLADIGFSLQHQSVRDLPRTYFRSGYIPEADSGNKTSGRKSFKRCGQDIPGIMLCILILLCSANPQSDDIRQHLGTPEYDEDDELVGIDRRGEYINILDKLLLFEAWMKQPKIPAEDLDLVDSVLPTFMMIFKNTVHRTRGEGLKIRKFHHTLHIPKAIRDMGVPMNYSGQNPESNMKENVKQNARRTQKRQHTIDGQTAVRFVESRVIAITDYHATKESTNNFPCVTSQKKIPSLRMGVRWRSINSMGNTHLDQKFNKHIYLLDQNWKSLYLSFDAFKTFLRKHIHPYQPSNNRGDTTVLCFTEYAVDNTKYHANPLWKKSGWQDWVIVDTDNKGKLPCHLMCFIEIVNNLDPSAPSLTGDVVPGKYAIVQYVPEDPGIVDLDKKRTKTIYKDEGNHYFLSSDCLLLRWSAKMTDSIHRLKEPLHWSSKQEEPWLALVNVDRFLSPCIAVPDPNQTHYPHAWIFVLPDRKKWGDLFMHYATDLSGIDVPDERYPPDDNQSENEADVEDPSHISSALRRQKRRRSN